MKTKAKIASENQTTLKQLLSALFPHAGERGVKETPQQTLSRIIGERDTAIDAAYFYRAECKFRTVMIVLLSGMVVYAGWKIRVLRSILP